MKKVKKSDVLSLCLEHNFWTWSAQKEIQPIPVDKAEGVYFWDFEGKRYLDFNSMVMCSNIGHGDKRVVEAINEQARELAFAGPHMATYPRAAMGKLLSEITPSSLTKFLYTLGGADANENAIKLARAFTGRHKVIARYRSYHGASHDTVALTGDLRRVAWEPYVMPGVVHVPLPYRYRDSLVPHADTLTDAQYTQRHLDFFEDIVQYEGPHTIAAVILEPVTGTNGILIPPQGYLQGIRSICDRYGILLITDEVMTGFGRTGEWFAVNHWQVVPDMMTLAKGLTSGYAPLGAVAMKEEIAAFFNDRVYQGGLTYNGHPISLAAALANIEVIQQDNLVQHADEMGEVLSDLLKELMNKHPSIGDVRSIGLFAAIELVKDRNTREPLSPYGQTCREMTALKKYTRKKGLFHYTHDNIILIIPPLIINNEQLEEGFCILDEALDIIDSALE